MRKWNQGTGNYSDRARVLDAGGVRTAIDVKAKWGRANGQDARTRPELQDRVRVRIHER
jgi:hypothetical protein